ncbi:MAG: MFS transporter, partial [Steroidobacteraceae bacterium]
VKWLLATTSLAGVFLYFLAQGAIWSYFGRIGDASGVNSIVVGRTLAIASLASIGGALTAVVVAGRTGRGWPLILSGGLSLLSFFLLFGHVAASALIAAGVLFRFAWTLSQPLLSGLCAEADAEGRVVVAMGSIQTVGTGLGPAIAAALLQQQRDFAPIIWMSILALLASLVVVLAGMRGHSRVSAGDPVRVPGHR